MKTIRVVKLFIYPKKGEYIKEQICDCFQTDEGFPAIRYKGESSWSLFAKEHTLVFAKDVIQAGIASDEEAKREARLSGFARSNSGAMLGAAPSVGLIGSVVVSAIGSLVTGAVGAVSAKTSGMKGFWVDYLNSAGFEVRFLAVGEAELVEEIINSIPEKRIDKDPSRSLRRK